MSETGIVFSIQRFSIHDGPGIRTTVFLKGCSMSCFWCHNPEGRKPRPQLMYHEDRCISCGVCVDVCPNHAHRLFVGEHTLDWDSCETVGECVKVCCSEALEMIGKRMTVDEVVTESLRDRPFYETSDGGVTISGGEPTLRSSFCRAILEELCAVGVHTAIETCGNCHWEDLESLLPVTDLVMMDLKQVDNHIHREVTGAKNVRILENARHLAETGIPLLLRTPIIPGVNDDRESFEGIVDFVVSLIELRRQSVRNRQIEAAAPIEYELLRFHKLAADKYRDLGMIYAAANLEIPSIEHMNRLAALSRSCGLDVTVR
jgi:pyruvate formate lyase activating enzyme